jgi:hypothetical protein
MLVVQGAVPCQLNWHQVHAIKGVAGVHTSCVSVHVHLAHASAPPITTMKQAKSVVVELCKKRQRCPVGLQGQKELLCRVMVSP